MCNCTSGNLEIPGSLVFHSRPAMTRKNLKGRANARLFVCAQKSEAMPLFSQSP